jgi:LysM repeat protein
MGVEQFFFLKKLYVCIENIQSLKREKEIIMKTYTVKAGDNLTRIASENGTTVAEIVKNNNIKDPNVIEIGQELSLGKTTEDAKTASDQPETKPEMSPEEIQQRLEKLEKENAELRSQTVGDVIERDIARGIDYCEEKIEQGKEYVVDKYNEGKEYVVDKYNEGVQYVKDTAHNFDENFDATLDSSSERLGNYLNEVQAKKVKMAEDMKFKKEQPVDTSNMTIEEKIDYLEKSNADLKDRTISDMIGDGLKDLWNGTVDTVHEWGTGFRKSISKGLNKITNGLKNLFNW